jgi:hypothetical protein
MLRPDKHQAIWQHRMGQPSHVVDFLARHHKVSRRSVYNWIGKFKTGGLPALVKKSRKDKGKSHILNSAALDFLLAAALPHKSAYGELSVREIYRSYLEERTWRLAHAGKPLSEIDRKKYRRYLDAEGRFIADAQLPYANYDTLRRWFDKIPDVLKVMAREGEEAFSNTQEILSFREISEVQPLDYVIMDHRRLDLFSCPGRRTPGS